MTRKIRVVRVLEYTYDSLEHMLDDQARWYVGVIGKRTHRHTTIKSATLPPELLEHLEETVKDDD